MSKQINLTLAQTGDVAVLRNGEKYEIQILHKFDPRNYKRWINLGGYLICYNIDGVATSGKHNDILDILRNGVSIFEPINQNQPHE